MPPRPMPTRVRTFDLMTTSLPSVLQDLVDVIVGGADVGERYAVTMVVHGPLTMEEAVTAIWEKVHAAEIS